MAQFPLKRNSEGKAVAYLQLAINPILKKRRLLPLAVNGRFDYDTEAAIDRIFGTKQVSQELYIKYFQSLSSGLKGPLDWNGYVPPAPNTVSFPLQKGSSNKDAVVLVQLWINRLYREGGNSKRIVVDGLWGKGTTAALKEVANGNTTVSKAAYEGMYKNAKYTTQADWNTSEYKAPKGENTIPEPTTGQDNGGGGNNGANDAPEVSKMAVPLLIAGAAGFILPSFITDAYGQPDQRFKMIGSLLGLGAGGYGVYLMATSLLSGGGGGGKANLGLSYPMSAYKIAADEIYSTLQGYYGIILTDGQANEIKDKIVSFVKSSIDWQTLKTAYGARSTNFYSFAQTLPKMIKGALPEQTQFEINAHLSQFGAKL